MPFSLMLTVVELTCKIALVKSYEAIRVNDYIMTSELGTISAHKSEVVDIHLKSDLLVRVFTIRFCCICIGIHFVHDSSNRHKYFVLFFCY